MATSKTFINKREENEHEQAENKNTVHGEI